MLHRKKLLTGVVAVFVLGIGVIWWLNTQANIYSTMSTYAFTGNDAMLQKMIEKHGGVDVAFTTHWGYPSLLSAAVNGQQLSTVKLLLDAGADPRLEDEPELLLQKAISNHGNAEIVQALISHGAPISDFCIFLAVHYQSIDNVHVLMAAGVDPDTSSTEGTTPLMLAAQAGDTELVRILLAAGADASLKNNDSDTALSIARQFGHTEIVDVLENRDVY